MINYEYFLNTIRYDYATNRYGALEPKYYHQPGIRSYPPFGTDTKTYIFTSFIPELLYRRCPKQIINVLE